MLRVNEKALLDEVARLNGALASVEKKADEIVGKLTDVPAESKAHIKDVLIADFSREPKEKLERLMEYVIEEPDPDPIPTAT